MLARQRVTGTRVIYPLAVWDGDKYAAEARALGPHDYNRWGTLERGMRRKRWTDTVVELVKELETLVRGCPAHDPAWTIALHPDPPEPHIDRQGH